MSAGRLGTASLLISLLLASGCSWLSDDEGMLRDRKHDYRQAQVIERIELPSQLSDEAILDLYPIPPISNEWGFEDDVDVPRPDTAANLDQENLVRIQKLGSEQWILVELAPGQVWSQLQGFANRYRLPLHYANPEQGLIDTGWLEPSEEGLPTERYRMRIDQGIQRGTTELKVVQTDRRYGDEWPRYSANRDRETALLQTLAQYIADTASTAPVSLLAQQGLSAAGKVAVREQAQGYRLELQSISYERAWASLYNALESAGFKVVDHDSRAGFLLVEERPDADAEDEDARTWSDRLFGIEAHEGHCSDDWFSCVTGIGAIDRDEAQRERLRVAIAAPGSDTIAIEIMQDGGVALPVVIQKKLLARIKGHLT